MEIIGYVYILCLYPSLLTQSSKNYTGYFISIKNAKKRKKPFVRKLSCTPFSDQNKTLSNSQDTIVINKIIFSQKNTSSPHSSHSARTTP